MSLGMTGAVESAVDAANQRKVELAIGVVRRPKLNDKDRSTVLSGLVASIESNALAEIIKEFLYLLPKYNKLDHNQKETFNQAFQAAISKKRADVLELFLGEKYKLRLSVEEIVKGLATAVATGDEAIIERMVVAVANIPGDERAFRGNCLADTLRSLMLKNLGHWVKDILEKQQGFLKANLGQFAQFCAQNHLFKMLAYFISKDPKFATISLTTILEKLLDHLEKSSDQSNSLTEQTLLKLIVVEVAPHINSTLRPRVLAFLLKIDALEHVKILFAAHKHAFSQDELEQILAYGIAKEECDLVGENVQLRRKGQFSIYVKWSPSLESLKAAIDRGNQSLLKHLLSVDPSDQFIAVAKDALVYAASIGKKAMVHEILVSLIAANTRQYNVKAAQEAASNGHFEVVEYLFTNLPGITISDKRRVLENAAPAIKEQVEALIRQEVLQTEGAALLKGTLGLVKANLKGEPLTNGTLFPRLRAVLDELEKKQVASIVVPDQLGTPQQTLFNMAQLEKELDGLELSGSTPAVTTEPPKEKSKSRCASPVN
ncbi:MAG: ankyrin repeat domain-containing protein [Proteobacteria bacterium]|nr:ankyrin repeat domain-containing protein [Pseudomonadota bacterium]